MGLKRLSTEEKISFTLKALAMGVLVLLLSGCGVNYQISTLNHDPIYDTNGISIEVDIINNEWELRNKLRTDFNFRYDFAQYALRQPPSFDWRFNRGYNQYSIFGTNTWGYNNYFWNRDQMWMDWVWGYPYGNGMGWSYSWGNNSWSSNHWNSPYGWNNYYGWGNGYGWNNNGWNNGYRRGSNVAYNIGRRGSTMYVRDRIGEGAMIESTKVKNRRTINTNVTPIPNNTRVREVRSSEVRVIQPRRASTVITPIRNYNRIENNSNNNNSRPIRTYSPPPRTAPTKSSTPVVITKGRGNN